MEKKDFIDLSPVQYFNVAANPLKTGEIGLITAKKGLGKTSILVQFGLDFLVNDKSLVHVAFDQQASNTFSWYSSIIAEVSKQRNVSNLAEITEEIIRNRTILNFNQDTFTLPKVVSTIKALSAGGIKINSIIVDDLDLGKVTKEDIKVFAEFVKEENLVAWFSYASEATDLSSTLPVEIIDNFTTVAHLAANGDNLELSILKNGNGKVKVNTKTLLLSK